VIGGALTGAGCVAAIHDLNWLWLAISGLAINWFGDSLDGSVARHRGIERPRFGFFLDQFSDVASHFLMLIGMGLSPLMQFHTALLALLGSLLVMFYGHLRLPFTRTWQVSHNGIGPTELRLVIIAGLLIVIIGGIPALQTPFGEITLFDAGAILVFVGAVASVLTMFRTDRAKWASIDGPRDNHEPEEVVMISLPAPQTFHTKAVHAANARSQD